MEAKPMAAPTTNRPISKIHLFHANAIRMGPTVKIRDAVKMVIFRPYRSAKYPANMEKIHADKIVIATIN